MLLRGASEDDCQDWIDCLRMAADADQNNANLHGNLGADDQKQQQQRSFSEPFGHGPQALSGVVQHSELPAATKSSSPPPATPIPITVFSERDASTMSVAMSPAGPWSAREDPTLSSAAASTSQDASLVNVGGKLVRVGTEAEALARIEFAQQQIARMKAAVRRTFSSRKR